MRPRRNNKSIVCEYIFYLDLPCKKDDCNFYIGLCELVVQRYRRLCLSDINCSTTLVCEDRCCFKSPDESLKIKTKPSLYDGRDKIKLCEVQ